MTTTTKPEPMVRRATFGKAIVLGKITDRALAFIGSRSDKFEVKGHPDYTYCWGKVDDPDFLIKLRSDDGGYRHVHYNKGCLEPWCQNIVASHTETTAEGYMRIGDLMCVAMEKRFEQEIEDARFAQSVGAVSEHMIGNAMEARVREITGNRGEITKSEKKEEVVHSNVREKLEEHDKVHMEEIKRNMSGKRK